MAHPNARLSVFGRQLLVSRVAQGWPASEAAKQLGVSRATAYKWLRRHRDEGCSTGAAARTAHHAACRTTKWPAVPFRRFESVWQAQLDSQADKLFTWGRDFADYLSAFDLGIGVQGTPIP